MSEVFACWQTVLNLLLPVVLNCFLGWFYSLFFGENLHKFTLLFLPYQSLEYGWWVLITIYFLCKSKATEAA
jgi:hypothetical protein